jgi:hypothetical protein
VAIPAIDAHATDVVCVAELDWLRDEDRLVGVISRPVQHPNDPPEKPDENQDREYAQSGIDVGSSVEDLTHRVDVRGAFPRAYMNYGAICRGNATMAAPVFCGRLCQ